MTYPGPGVIYAVNIRLHPVRNRLIYDNLILLDDEATYVRTGTEETGDIKEISFYNRSLLITIIDAEGYTFRIYADLVSYETLKALYEGVCSS